MKKYIFNASLFILILFSCRDEYESVFDKPADVRVAEAIANLKQELVRPPNGWKVRYKPENESGSYWVLMTFSENNEVTIKSDLPHDENGFFEQTITYRIDSSLGLELILESYSFFSFLFEQDQATFLAEYEFHYANKTPQGELVFVSKTDPGSPTTLVFQEAGAVDGALLAQQVSPHLQKYPASTRIVYVDKNLAVYMTMDGIRRTANFNYVSLKTTTQNGQGLNHFTPFLLQGDSIIFDNALDVNFNGNRVYLKSIKLVNPTETTTNICPEPSTVPLFEGFTSLNDKVVLETSFFDNNGASFRTRSDIFVGNIGWIFNENGQSMGLQVVEQVKGASLSVIYNNANGLNAMGFLIDNGDGTTAIVVKQYTATFTGNIVEFNFADNFTIFRELKIDTNIDNINFYLDKLTVGGKTYIYRLNQSIYQLYNPCSGWRFYFQALD